MPEFRNPNLQTQGSGGTGGGGGDMRFMLAFTFLAVVAILGYQYFFQKPQQQQQVQQQLAQQYPQQVLPAGQQPAGTTPSNAAATAPVQPAVPAVVAASATETTVENDVYKIVFTNQGAQVKQWILKKYRDHAGKPLDMVHQVAAQKYGLPLSFFTYEPELTSQLNQALYQPSATGNLSAPNSLSFHYVANGLDVVKTFHFDASYVVAVEAQVKRNGSPVRALVAWPAGLGDQEDTMSFASSEFVYSIDGKDDTVSAKKISGNGTLIQPYDYATVSDAYFTSAFLPDVPQQTTVVTLSNSIDVPVDVDSPNSARKPVTALGLAMGDTSGYTRLRIFAGPKDTTVLTSIQAIGADGKPNGPSLEPLVQFGWLTVLAKPLYFAMRYLHSRLGSGAYNWGWAIIIITVIINLLMLPTRLMMMRSSVKMARVQPEVEALKRRFAHLKFNDPKRAEMNTEMMALYKREGINMYGGCLPMLIQMPLLYAIYRVFRNAVELRQAHWFWLHDLSMPDPLYILPIIVILSMLFVQLLTPSPGMDQTQRRMMAFMMPAVFGFSMLHFASGLALYWCTGNVLNLIMQLAINKSSLGRELHAHAAKRAAKQAAKRAGGSSRTIEGRR